MIKINLCTFTLPARAYLCGAFSVSVCMCFNEWLIVTSHVPQSPKPAMGFTCGEEILVEVYPKSQQIDWSYGSSQECVCLAAKISCQGS